jgi:acetyltransferase
MLNPISAAEPHSEWIAKSFAKAGTSICIRPLRPDDREREVAFINSLSQESLYFRLLTPLKYLPRHLLDQLMDVDGERRMAFVATIAIDGQERIIGIARYGETDERGTVELGITVADDWHRQGIAVQLLKQLFRYARARGYEKMTGLVLPQNRSMLALAHRMGFRSHHVADGLIRIDLSLKD